MSGTTDLSNISKVSYQGGLRGDNPVVGIVYAYGTCAHGIPDPDKIRDIRVIRVNLWCRQSPFVTQDLY